MYRIVPELQAKLSLETRLIASEPTGKTRDLWAEVPQGSYLRVEKDGRITIRPFKPMPPGHGAGATGT